MSHTPDSPTPPPPDASTVCPICQAPIEPDEPKVTCVGCSTAYHEACWEYNRGCAQYGCDRCPPTEKLTDLEVPVSYWGREEKACPKCGKVIQAAAVRCRHCGAVFDSARPVEAGEYDEAKRMESRLPALRKQAVVLLIFSVFTCTAPICAVIGLIWYARNRRAIARLPAMHATVCRIAVGLACLQTVVLVFFAALHYLLNS